MNRKNFMLRNGATCSNWTWSWSFVNHKEKVIFFGTWFAENNQDKELILSEQWEYLNKRKQPGYSQALEHIKLIEKGYKLRTFKQIYSDERRINRKNAPAKIKKIIPDTNPRTLRKIGIEWFATPLETEEKVARVCWNTNDWQKPSGREGKSRDQESYESLYGFGHEEWLLDTTKPINGYHYGHLKAIGAHRNTYLNRVFNIHLYSINAKEKERLWIGKIKNVEVTTIDESIAVYKEYKRNGWLAEMKSQLVAVGGNIVAFEAINPAYFAVIKYKALDLELLDHPLKFSANDNSVKSDYYNLKDFVSVPNSIEKQHFKFKSGHNKKASTARHSYSKKAGEKDLQHNRMQDALYELLVKEYGKSNVGTENNSGNGTFIDAVARHAKKYTFYEIKTAPTVTRCIREAIGQLLEYAHYNKEIGIESLIIIGLQPITKEANTYLANIRKLYSLPIIYNQLKIETMELL
ncbi:MULTISPECIES: hypothetical protein [unclassified Methylophilus]|uniref:hypothetical protein n=1 Tax=unclassified Methylophilus TaxID=2630143 RepID=UPI0006F98A15|nr:MULTISPECIES: hypothetical protein [unclassified Methylophilus]KQT41203.1 hypothetical protein ASG34_10610 [Methylophilus sp. Leaf416]KQT58413.1 hypothetical protein ASG44_12165 [Methylophilus sp. Leaf459]